MLSLFLLGPLYRQRRPLAEIETALARQVTVNFGPRPSEAAQGSSRASGGREVKGPYNLSIALATQNLLNHTNPGPIVGNITSPLFGRANQPSGGAGNGGFSEAANNRRLELQMRFTF